MLFKLFRLGSFSFSFSFVLLLHLADASGPSRRPLSPHALSPEVRYYLLLDLNGTICEVVSITSTSRIERKIVVYGDGVDDFLNYCWEHFEVFLDLLLEEGDT